MIKEFSFRDIKKYLEKENNTAILDAFDKLTDVVIIFSPIALGVNFLPLLELLDVKERMVDVGRTVIDFISSKKHSDYIKRAEQIKISYSLITYTSYLEALYEKMPKVILRKLKKKFDDKKIIEKMVVDTDDTVAGKIDVNNMLPFSDHITSFSETVLCLEKIYEKVSDSLIQLIETSEIFGNDIKGLEKAKKLIESIPERAKEIYVAQYQHLACEFDDFGIYVQSLEFQSLYNQNVCNKEILQVVKDSVDHIDVGMNRLHSLVKMLPNNFTKEQTLDIVGDIKNKYNAAIEKPIINNEEISSKDEEFSLVFPQIKEAFIPQSYKSLAYTSKDIHLEDEKTWEKQGIRKDLPNFFVKYLSSPDSIEYPLIILGHPGSGKSLLTKILSAQLMSHIYTVIRVPLREINPDLSIDLLVEEQIKKLTNRTLNEGYGGFAKQFNKEPLIIILDGYDELLQAKGEVFAGYLENARRFQQDQKDLGRPVRIIVTSRITLIDKAIVPINSSILRLLEFDSEQQNAWINIWNNANQMYFKSKEPEIRPFSLPKWEKGQKNSILELAEQPLLLLMLALYDSEDNSLVGLQNDLKRTVLYENLLRRFVRRERSRYIPDFNELENKKQEEYIDQEMKRLGVVAIGMYNRKKLYIRTKELDNDLVIFESERDKNSNEHRKLKDSESLLGGFFFIHQSMAQDISANSDNSDSAFEFLHNTFGEFLTADMILRYAVHEIAVLKEYNNNDLLINELNKKLNDPNGLCKEWFNCLMFTPLFSRPVILEMIKEHVTNVIKEKGISKEDFTCNFKQMIQSQLKIILNTQKFPQIMSNEQKEVNIPLIGLISIYTLNLVILASVLIDDGFIFDESHYTRENVSDSETTPWDKLTFLWRTWFSKENLTGLSVIFNAERNDNIIKIKSNEKYEAKLFKQPIDIQLSVSNAFSEYLNIGLAGLHTENLNNIIMLNDNEIADFFQDKNDEIYFSFLITCIRRKKLNSFHFVDYHVVNDLFKRIIHTVNIKESNNNTLLSFIEVVRSCLSENIIYTDIRKQLMSYFIDLFETMTHQKGNNIIYNVINIVKELGKNIQALQMNGEMFYKGFHRYSQMPYIEGFKFYDRSIYEINKMKNRIFYDEDGQKQIYNILFNNLFEDTRQANKLEEIVDKIDFINIIKSNPELASHVILALKRNRNFIRKYSKTFFEFVVENIETDWIHFIGYNTLINSIKIAQETSNNVFLEYVTRLFDNYLSYQNMEKLSVLIITQPLFVIELLDVLPDLFSNLKNVDESLTGILFYKNINCYSKDTLIAYIRCIKKIYGNKYIDEIRDKLFQIRRSFDNYFFAHLYDDISKCTLEELENIFWFAKVLKDDKLLNKIKEMQFHFDSYLNC